VLSCSFPFFISFRATFIHTLICRPQLSKCLTFLSTSSTTKTSSTLLLPDPERRPRPSLRGRSGQHPNYLPRSCQLLRQLPDQNLVLRSTQRGTLNARSKPRRPNNSLPNSALEFKKSSPLTTLKPLRRRNQRELPLSSKTCQRGAK
jgi:hypothetical protein